MSNDLRAWHMVSMTKRLLFLFFCCLYVISKLVTRLRLTHPGCGLSYDLSVPNATSKQATHTLLTRGFK